MAEVNQPSDTEVNPFEGWTTIEEAAEIIKRQNTTVHYWARNGSIRCYRVGRKVKLVNIDEVKDYAAQNPGLSQRRNKSRQKKA